IIGINSKVDFTSADMTFDASVVSLKNRGNCMLRSFSEFKFYQSFRVPVEEADDIRFLVEIGDGKGKSQYIDDAKLVDISLSGVSFTTVERLSVGQELDFSLHFKKYHLDLAGKVVRAFAGGIKEENLLYGVEFEETDSEEIRRFLEQFVSCFSPERLKDSMIQMVLTDRYSTAVEGMEMFSLLVSLLKVSLQLPSLSEPYWSD
ncbi:MAG: PilZ domain-containing protein, partial [Oligoflexia bacterium]|nr:PilZ domain-containing protein [Oligoflexia bacterium]